MYEISQPVWAIFLVLNVIFAYTTRELIREALERRWKAGIGLKRVLIAGSGDLGRLVADKVLEHRELGFKVLGFLDDRAGGDHIGYRGLPLLGTLGEADEIIRREKIDHLYVALPLEEHVKMLGLVEATNREGVDLHVVPDLLQFIALRARLENLDGVPIISLNDVPLRGLNSILKRAIDMAISGVALLGLGIPFLMIAALIKRTSSGPVFYKQERMGLDGKAFQVFKFRSMYEGAEDETGPVWARDNDPRCTPLGRWLRRFDLDELPQLWNVLRGDMSIVGPRPERPYFVEQFKHRIPQVHASSQGEGRHYRVGAGERLARQHVARKAHRIRPVLHRELVRQPRPQDHVADRAEGVAEARLLRCFLFSSSSFFLPPSSFLYA